MFLKILSREESKILGNVYYFTAKPCRYGHIDKRYTNTGICYECKRVNMKLDYIRNKERVILTNNNSNKKHYAKRVQTVRNWQKRNKEKVKEIKKRNKIKYKEKYNKANAARDKFKRNTNIFYRLSRNISKALWASLKGSKGYRHWFDLVGYTASDLKNHLENKFKKDMSWKNYGTYWEIDHIIPLSWFPQNDNFIKDAWKLNNLQPLELFLNRSKLNRYAG